MNGVDSNLDSHGASIFLHEIGGVIIGSTAALTANVNAGNTIFSIAVNGTGVVTLTQFAQIDHPIAADPTPTVTPFEDQLAVLGSGLVTLTGSATITDFDGDTATDSAVVDLGGNVRFADDGPTIDVTAGDGRCRSADDAGRADGRRPDQRDTAVSTANFGGVFAIGSSATGADGAGLPAAALSYALDVVSYGGVNGVDSNLDSHGASIFLHEIGGVIAGSTEALTANVNAGNTIFSIAVNGTGVVTLTQFAQIDHPIADDPTPTATPFEDQLAVLGSGLVTLTGSATITDFDGDTATDSEVVDLGGNVRFADDGPTIDVTAGADAGVLLTTQDAQTDRRPGQRTRRCRLRTSAACLRSAARRLARTAQGCRRRH